MAANSLNEGITAKTLNTAEQQHAAAAVAMKTYGKAIMSISRRGFDMRKHMSYSQYIRDNFIWGVPILPGAVTVYQQMSAGREWTITGKLKAALRTVDFIQRTEVVDTTNGMRYFGFEEFLRRRSLDSIATGRTAFLYRKNGNYIEYLDPTQLVFKRNSNSNTPVRDSEKVWNYAGENIRFDEVFLSHHMPIGAKGAIVAPLHFLVPSANLAYLVREHDTAAADGRKIRDILLVASDQVADAIKDALQSSLSLWAGEDPGKVGVPMVAVNNLSGQPVGNMIAKLGLAEIPETFNRESFTFNFANEISAALGLALRHFWNEETTTNRALEEVQEQRQLQKGPSAYIKSEERLINSSKILRKFGRVRFAFIEEVDQASLKTKAEVLKMSAEGLGQFAAVFQAQLNLDAAVAWMQSLQVIPYDLDILLPGGEESSNGIVTRNPDENPTPNSNDEQIVDGNEPPVQSSNEKSAVPDYDEVVIDMNGKVLNRRYKIFQVTEYLTDLMEQEGVQPVQKTNAEEAFDELIKDVRTQNAESLRVLYSENKRQINKWAKNSGTLYSEDEIKCVLKSITSDEPLTDDQHTIVSTVLERYTENG